MGLKSEEIDYVSRYSPVVTCKLTAARVNEIAAQKSVLRMEYVGDFDAKPEETTISQIVSDSNGNYLKNNYGWNGSGVKVGVIESSYYITSASGIANRVKVENPNSPNSSGLIDYQDHANLVGAIIAGDNGFASGATVYSTVAGGSFANFKIGIEALLDRGVTVINMSLAIPSSVATGTVQSYDEWCDHITSEHNVTFENRQAMRAKM